MADKCLVDLLVYLWDFRSGEGREEYLRWVVQLLGETEVARFREILRARGEFYPW